MKRLLSIMLICLFLCDNMLGNKTYPSEFQLPESDLYTTGEGNDEGWRIKFYKDETATVTISPIRYTFTGDAQRTPAEQLGTVNSIIINHFSVRFIRNDDVEIKEVSLLYKVHEVGMNAEWEKIDATQYIEEMRLNAENRYESHMYYELYPPVIEYNVTEGLTSGKDYVLEVKFQVVDTEDNTFTLLDGQECCRFYFSIKGEDPEIEPAVYRPFIEEGKVWKVGYFMGKSDRASMLHYYYFDGDTIVNNRSCTKMVCRHEAAESWGSTELWTEYVGAVYEENRKVYYAFPEKDQLILLYDFASPVDEPVVIYNMSFEVMSQGFITKRCYSESETYKGTITYVGQKKNGYEGLLFIWMEGVGNSTYPISHVYDQTYEYAFRKLMSCTVGDEVLYYNPSLVDGVTPEGADVKKHWIDFTHIKKPRPKAPARERTANETDEENLTGEYSVKELFVNLKILSGAYTVTLKDAAGNEVYRKEVQTSSTIALNTDLTKYPEGTYTLVVENSEEQYTATLTLPLDDVAVRDIPASIVNGKSVNSKCFDLSGRRLSTPPAKGIYIRDGRKVVVK